MKVTDLTLTLFKWSIAPWHTGGNSFGGERQLGLVTIHTDEGAEGYSFLGSSRQGADDLAGPLMEELKPVGLGRNPLDIGAIWADMWRLSRWASPRALGAVDVALWDVAGKVAGLPIQPFARLLQRAGACLRELRLPPLSPSVRRGGPSLPFPRLDRIQDSSARPAEGRRGDIPGCPSGGR